MSKKNNVIFIFIVILLMFGIKSNVYGYSGNIDKEIASWHSDFSSSEATEENMKNWKKELLKKLSSTFNYDAESINEKMAMKTKIYITKEDGDSCTIRIRKQRSSRNWQKNKRRIKGKLGMEWQR